MSPAPASQYRAPTGIAGAALVFWGVVTGHWVIGILLAALVEARRVMQTRWEVSNQFLSRIWALCSVMFLVSLVIGLIREGAARAAFFGVEWMPLCGLPLILAQVYSTHEGIPIRVLSVISRLMERKRRRAGHPPRPDKVLNVEYPYVCAVLIAASARRPEGVVFYIGAVLLVACGLFLSRERPRTNFAVWAVVALIAAVLGFVGHIGLHNLHVYLENAVVGLNVAGLSSAMKRSVTRLGDVGEIKLSRRIDWWVKPVSGETPGYLRRAAYDTYRREMWLVARGRDLVAAEKKGENDDIEWQIPPKTNALADAQLEIVGRRHGEETHLALPMMPLTLKGLKADTVARARLGLTVVAETPRVLDFSVRYRSGDDADLPPGEDDLFVAHQLRPGLDSILGEASAAGLEPKATVTALTRFFHQKFAYSTYMEISRAAGEPVLAFLQQHRKGHCEYFASATVLLLRRAGVPARYVTGHVVREYDERRQRFVLRGLHAHAWVQAWWDGRWRYVDTTPGSWLQTEHSALSYWQPIIDWFQGLPLAWAMWIKSPAGRGFLAFVKWGTLPLLAVYLWFRLFRGQRGRRVRAGADAERATCPGTDSEWYTLEPALVGAVGGRHSGEPLGLWWRRVRVKCPESVRDTVTDALALHYRLRFDPQPMGEGDRKRLRELVSETLNSTHLAPRPTSV